MATYDIRSPSGQAYKINAPDDATEEEVLAYAKSNFQKEPPKEPVQTDGDGGFIGNVKEAIGERNRKIQETLAAAKGGEIGNVQGAIQSYGNVFGAGWDVAGEVVSRIPGVKQLFQTVGESPVGQDIGAVSGLLKKGFGEFESENPQAGKTIRGATNIAMAFAPVKGGAGPSPVAKASARVRRAGVRQSQANRKSFIDGLVSPKETPSELLKQVPRTTEKGSGPFKRSVVELSPQEKLMVAEVTRIPGITPKKTVQGNYNIISKRNTELAKELEKRLAREKATIPMTDMVARIQASIDDVVRNNPTVVGDPALAAKANRVGQEAVKILSEGKLTPLGVLQSRRALDSWLLNNRPKVFDQAENTLSASGRAVRDVMNQTIEDLAPSAMAKDSLRRQSTLYGVMENVAPKAAAEGNNAVSRLWQNTGNIIGVRNRLVQDMAVLFGVGGLGAASMFAPIITKTAMLGGTALVAGKIIMHPSTKIALAKMIKLADKAIIGGKDPSLLRQMRADRAVLVEMIGNAETDESMPMLSDAVSYTHLTLPTILLV